MHSIKIDTTKFMAEPITDVATMDPSDMKTKMELLILKIQVPVFFLTIVLNYDSEINTITN